MAERYDAVAAREYERDGEKKSSFTNIGVAFKMKDRDGFSLRLHCLPAPTDGEYTILLFPPKPRDDQRQNGNRPTSYDEPNNSSKPDLTDEIPF